jgi:hypothetical protein
MKNCDEIALSFKILQPVLMCCFINKACKNPIFKGCVIQAADQGILNKQK